MKFIFLKLFLFLMVLGKLTSAQDFSATMQEIEKIKAAYKEGNYLSYQMKYLYSKESAPAKYLDSLIGSFKTHDSSFYGKIGKIEFLQNGATNLSLYNQDKIILVNNPVKQEDKLMPLASWDSVFVAFNMDTTLVTEKGSTRTLEFKFSPAANYKDFMIQYDVKTYLLKKIVITTKQAPVDNGAGQVKNEGNIVTILFSNYSTALFDKNIFSETKYIQVQGAQITATAAYTGFRLIDLRKTMQNK